MKKPSITTVKNWYTVFESDVVKVEQGSVPFEGHTGDFFRVTPRDGRVKSFFGESAWMHAQRVASDIDHLAWGY